VDTAAATTVAAVRTTAKSPSLQQTFFKDPGGNSRVFFSIFLASVRED